MRTIEVVRVVGTLAELRRAYGMTQAQLGKILGLDAGDVSRLEAGTLRLGDRRRRRILGAVKSQFSLSDADVAALVPEDAS